MKKHTLAGIAALAATVAVSQGAVVSESGTFTGKTVGTSFQIPLLKFSPSLGTLQSIELKLEVTTSPTNTLRFDNEGGAGNAALQLGANVKAQTGVNLLTTVNVAPLVATSGSVGADGDGAPDFAGSDFLALTGGTNATGTASQNTAPYIAQFTAAAPGHSYPVTISSTLFTSAPPSTGTSGVFGATSTSAQTYSGKVTVTYTYLPLAAVPEAGTILFGAALGLAIAFRRSRPVAANA